MVNIPFVQSLNLSPMNLNIVPFSPVPIAPMSLSQINIVGTDYTFHAGGEDWMLCTVSTGVDQYALALFYAGASEPILWDEDVTLTFSNGTMTAENNGSTVTFTYTSIYYKGNGDYVLMSESAYVMDDTNIIAFALPVAGNGIEVKGTIGSLTAANIGGDITVGDATATTSTTDHDGVSSLTQVSAAYDTDSTAVCTSIIVPNKVTVTETIENDVISTIMSIVPVFMLLAVLLMVGIVIVMRKSSY